MGLIHIYCGDGKGKTTAAIGLAVRAAGAGMRVHFAQLLKGGDTSELAVLKTIPSLTVERCDKDYGFTFSMSEAEKEQITQCHNRILSNALGMMERGEIGLLILDEFNAAYKARLVDRALAERIVLKKPEAAELVLTGREPDPRFVAAADYVSEIRAVKHPFERGIAARKGIEF